MNGDGSPYLELLELAISSFPTAHHTLGISPEMWNEVKPDSPDGTLDGLAMRLARDLKARSVRIVILSGEPGDNLLTGFYLDDRTG